MRFRGANRIKRWVGRMRPRPAGGGLILLYHRVADLPTDPQWLAVPPARFGEQLDVLRRLARPMPLRQLARCAADRNVPDRAVAVTFDDGYADNLIDAKPLLARHDVPATVFVATGRVAGGSRATQTPGEFFWDEVDRVLLQPGTLRGQLTMTVGGRTVEADPGPAADYTAEDGRRDGRWNVAYDPANDPTPRHGLYRRLCELIRPLPAAGQARALAGLRAWAGRDATPRPSHRSLTAAEVRELAAGGLVEVGAHTVTHPVLSALPAADQRLEVNESKTELERILGGPVTSFSYPYGTPADYTRQTVAAVREAGFTLACANAAGRVRKGVDLFQLPRVLVRDWHGDAFAARLEQWFRD